MSVWQACMFMCMLSGKGCGSDHVDDTHRHGPPAGLLHVLSS